MGKRIFHPALTSHCIRANLNAIVGVETSTVHLIASFTVNVICVDVSSEVIDLLAHESYDGT